MKIDQRLKNACVAAKAAGFKFMTVRRAPTPEGRDYKFIPLQIIINIPKGKLEIFSRDKTQRSRPWNKAPKNRKTILYQTLLRVYGNE